MAATLRCRIIIGITIAYVSTPYISLKYSLNPSASTTGAKYCCGVALLIKSNLSLSFAFLMNAKESAISSASSIFYGSTPNKD